MTSSKRGFLDLPIGHLAYRPVAADLNRAVLTKSWSRALTAPSTLATGAVAQIVDLNRFNLIVTLDNQKTVNGIVSPNHWIQTAVGLFGNTPASFSDAISRLVNPYQSNHLDLSRIVANRPKLYWCEAGKHLTTEDPCSEHSG